MENTPLSVSDALALINQTLEYAYPTIVIEGEVASYKVNQGKFVFFDIKDDAATMGCFMMAFQQRVPIEDGMKIRVVAQPKLTQWGKFSLTVREIHPVGEGSLRRSLQLLVAKLQKEGLLDEARKRSLPAMPERIAVISSVDAAGYADFMKIINQRWGGLEISVAHTAVQGASAAPQIIGALQYFNEQTPLPDIIVIVRGGGSMDDLSAFNDEPLARAIAASRIPVVTGIGHEVDTSVADMVADVRAATPTNAAMIVVPDKREVIESTQRTLQQILLAIERRHRELHERTGAIQEVSLRAIERRYEYLSTVFKMRRSMVLQLNPKLALKRGYSLLYDDNGRLIKSAKVGQTIRIETASSTITAGVTDVTNK